MKAARSPPQSAPAKSQFLRPTAVGREFVYVSIGDHSRIAFSPVLADEKQESAIAFVHTAVV